MVSLDHHLAPTLCFRSGSACDKRSIWVPWPLALQAFEAWVGRSREKAGMVPGCLQVILNHTRNTYDSESEWEQCAYFVQDFRAAGSQWLPANSITEVDNSTVGIPGTYGRLTPVVDTVINETGMRAAACLCCML